PPYKSRCGVGARAPAFILQESVSRVNDGIIPAEIPSGGSQPAQLGALGGVLDGPALGGDLRPQRVGGGPVPGLFGGGALFHQRLHVGGHFVLFAVVQQAQHAGQLVKDGGGLLQGRLGGCSRQGVDLLDQVEQGGQCVGGVQIVVHGGAELAARLGGLFLQSLIGAEAGLAQHEVQVFPAGVQPLEAV